MAIIEASLEGYVPDDKAIQATEELDRLLTNWAQTYIKMAANYNHDVKITRQHGI